MKTIEVEDDLYRYIAAQTSEIGERRASFEGCLALRVVLSLGRLQRR